MNLQKSAKASKSRRLISMILILAAASTAMWASGCIWSYDQPTTKYVHRSNEAFSDADKGLFDRDRAVGTVRRVNKAVNGAVSVIVDGTYNDDDQVAQDVTWHCDMRKGTTIPAEGDRVKIKGTWDENNPHPSGEDNVFLVTNAELE